MGHGNKGKKGKGAGKLPVIQALPIKEEVTDADLEHIGQRMHSEKDGPSESRFSVRNRTKDARTHELRTTSRKRTKRAKNRQGAKKRQGRRSR
jgi:hypothetical protein